MCQKQTYIYKLTFSRFSRNYTNKLHNQQSWVKADKQHAEGFWIVTVEFSQQDERNKSSYLLYKRLRSTQLIRFDSMWSNINLLKCSDPLHLASKAMMKMTNITYMVWFSSIGWCDVINKHIIRPLDINMILESDESVDETTAFDIAARWGPS